MRTRSREEYPLFRKYFTSFSICDRYTIYRDWLYICFLLKLTHHTYKILCRVYNIEFYKFLYFSTICGETYHVSWQTRILLYQSVEEITYEMLIVNTFQNIKSSDENISKTFRNTNKIFQLSKDQFFIGDTS